MNARKTRRRAALALAFSLLSGFSGCAQVQPVEKSGEFQGTCMPGDAECPICWRREGYPATAFLTAPVLLPACYAGAALASPVALAARSTKPMGVASDVLEVVVAPVAFPLWLIGRAIDEATGPHGPRAQPPASRASQPGARR